MPDTSIPAHSLDADALLERLSALAPVEVIREIFDHQKHHHGIDWLEAMENRGLEGLADAKRRACERLIALQAELGVDDEQLAGFTPRRLLEDDVQTMPTWFIDHQEAELWANAQGITVGEMVLRRLQVMQALELSSSDLGFAKLGLGIGVVAWVRQAWVAFRAARAAGEAVLSAVTQGVRAVTLSASRLFIGTVVVAIIAEVLLFVAEKDAAVFMILVNMTDDDLQMDQLAIDNGKQVVQFVDTLNGDAKTLSRRDGIEVSGTTEYTYSIGLFAARKRDYALVGTRGGLSFVPTPTFPNAVYAGWDVPLTFLGGKNRALVSTGPQDSIEAFVEAVDRDGTLDSSSESDEGIVTGRMHDGQGSEGYMAVVFQAKA